MAVLVEGISVIIKSAAALQAFGTWEAFKRIVPNQTLCADNELVRVGFMHPDDVKAFCEDLAAHGLPYTQDGEAQDFSVCDQQRGFMVRTAWAEFGTINWENNPEKPVKACRLRGSRSSQLFVPPGWVWERSLSHSFGFADESEIGRTISRLPDEGGLQVWRIPLSEGPFYTGRTTRRDHGDEE